MRSRFAKLYLYSITVILLSTAAAKVLTLIIGGQILAAVDPLWELKNGWVMALAAFVELSTAIVLWRKKDPWLAGVAGIVLGAEFLTYRVIFANGGFSHGCPCLGRIGDWLPVTEQHLSATLWWLAIWLFAGGIVVAWMLWSHHEPKRSGSRTFGNNPGQASEKSAGSFGMSS